MKTILTTLFLFVTVSLFGAITTGYNIPPLAAYNGDVVSNVTLVTCTNYGNTYLSNNVAPFSTITPTNGLLGTNLASGVVFSNGNYRSLLFGTTYGADVYYTNNGNPYKISVTNTFCIPLSPFAGLVFSNGAASNVVNWQ